MLEEYILKIILNNGNNSMIVSYSPMDIDEDNGLYDYSIESTIDSQSNLKKMFDKFSMFNNYSNKVVYYLLNNIQTKLIGKEFKKDNFDLIITLTNDGNDLFVYEIAISEIQKDNSQLYIKYECYINDDSGNYKWDSPSLLFEADRFISEKEHNSEFLESDVFFELIEDSIDSFIKDIV